MTRKRGLAGHVVWAVSPQRARVHLRRAIGGLLAVACVATAGCGSGGDSAGAKAPPPGAPSNPLVAESGEASATPTPGFDSLLQRQQAEPHERDATNVCTLVTKSQAEAISRTPLRDPFLAPQGPTCIYRYSDGGAFATLAIQPERIAAVRRQMQEVRRVPVSGRHGYCGVHGRPMLYLPVGRGLLLSIAAECDDAVRLARIAVPRIRR